jgi:hypothetical protein
LAFAVRELSAAMICLISSRLKTSMGVSANLSKNPGIKASDLFKS